MGEGNEGARRFSDNSGFVTSFFNDLNFCFRNGILLNMTSEVIEEGQRLADCNSNVQSLRSV